MMHGIDNAARRRSTDQDRQRKVRLLRCILNDRYEVATDALGDGSFGTVHLGRLKGAGKTGQVVSSLR